MCVWLTPVVAELHHSLLLPQPRRARSLVLGNSRLREQTGHARTQSGTDGDEQLNFSSVQSDSSVPLLYSAVVF